MSEKENGNVIRYEDTLDPKVTIHVKKLIDLEIDLGALLASDTNDLDKEKFQKDKDGYLKDLARDNLQLLFNDIWKLPSEQYEDAVVAKLPKPSIVTPREKKVPVPKPPTKWETFAKEKGIQKKKKTHSTWDDVLKKWVPRYGFKKAQAEKDKNWLIEVPESVDPYTDMYEKDAQKKQEKISKNEYQRLRNIAKAKNIKVPSMGLPPTDKLNSLQLNSAANIANVSTASVGKFQPTLSKEKTLNKASILPQKKRKAPHPTRDEEHARNMSLVDSILNKRPKLDLNKAVNREINSQQLQAHEDKKTKQGKGKKRSQGGGKGKSKGKPMGKPPGKPSMGKPSPGKPSAAKPKGNKGARIGKGGGRKRRQV